MSLNKLRLIIRLLYATFIFVLCFWIYATVEHSPYSVAIFQTLPLVLVAPLLIKFRSQHLHVVLPVVMIYMCFTAPNLFRTGPEAQIAMLELGLNILLSSAIMWYMLLASKAQRQLRAG